MGLVSLEVKIQLPLESTCKLFKNLFTELTCCWRTLEQQNQNNDWFVQLPVKYPQYLSEWVYICLYFFRLGILINRIHQSKTLSVHVKCKWLPSRAPNAFADALNGMYRFLPFLCMKSSNQCIFCSVHKFNRYQWTLYCTWACKEMLGN